ncbi:hypothetical protein [Bradyrhizobium sp. ORS 86]|uniref:hypothetical protein n=1 Tax=Bradyrhizobium sp. ORS 86 TaxID=1685970 RepID=UPI00388DE843
MSASAVEQKCNCLECRIRAALSGGNPAAPFEVDINEAIIALGEVMSELLAHVPTKSAKRFADELIVARKKWQAHPRVMAQQPHRGTA